MDGRAVQRTPYWVAYRLCTAASEAWDSWDGSLALAGVDIHSWTLKRLMNAAEAAIYQGCEDQKERDRKHAELYAPPREVVQARRAAGRAVASDADRAAAARMAAQMMAEDTKFGIV